MQNAESKRPDGILVASMGFLIIVAACGGVLVAVFSLESFDLATVALMVFGFLGTCALGIGLINAWRTPMLTIRPNNLKVPTFFGAREIPIKAGDPITEFLASSTKNRGSRGGTIESNKFVHFYVLDSGGVLTELVSLHCAAPEIAQIRLAFQDVAGLKVEMLKADPKPKLSRPDVAHWVKR